MMNNMILRNNHKVLARELSTYMDIQDPKRREKNYAVRLARLQSKIYPFKRESWIERIWVTVYSYFYAAREMKNAR